MGYRLFLAGGGTGGHVYPNLAFAGYLRKSIEIDRIFYLGLKSRPEYKIINRKEYSDYRFLPVRAHQFPRSKDPFQWFSFLREMLFGIILSIFYLFIYRPDIVISSGGFVSVPVLVSSAIYRIFCRIVFKMPPLILSVEPNVDPGLANSTFGLLSDRIFTAFDDTRRLYGEKAVYTGYPVRHEIKDIRGMKEDKKAMLREKLGIPEDRKIILVSGGSQGAKNINKLIAESIGELSKYRGKICIIHSTGLYSDDEYDAYEYTLSVIKQSGFLPEDISDFYKPHRFLYNMTDFLSICDLAVVRGGAGSAFEVLDAGIPAIFIPKIEIAGEHQLKNCREIYKSGLGMILYEYREKTEGDRSEIIISKKRFLELFEAFLGEDESFLKIQQNLLDYKPADTEALSAGFIEEELKERKEKHLRHIRTSLSIMVRMLIVLGVIAMAFLYYSRRVDFTGIESAIIFLMYFFLYLLRKDNFCREGLKIYVSNLSYAVSAIIAMTACYLLLYNIDDNISVLYIPLLVLISVDNMLRKLINKSENEFEAVLFLAYLSALSVFFYGSLSISYFYIWVSIYFLVSDAVLLIIFLAKGMKRQAGCSPVNDLVCFCEASLLTLFFFSALFYVNEKDPVSYKYLAVSLLFLIPFINLIVKMVRGKFARRIETGNDIFIIDSFIRGILFYTLPVIIVLLLLSRELQFLLSGFISNRNISIIFPFFIMLSPLLTLIPIVYVLIRMQKLAARRSYIIIFSGILLSDLALKALFDINAIGISVLFSLYALVFILLSLLTGWPKKDGKAAPASVFDNYGRIEESTKLIIIFSLFIFGILCFRFNRADSGWALFIPLAVSATGFCVFSRILNIKGPLKKAGKDKTGAQMRKEDPESGPALKFAQLPYEKLMKFDREYLILRLNSFRYGRSWWLKNCAVKLIGNMRKDDETGFLASVLTRKAGKRNIFFSFLTGDYEYNAIIRRNAIEALNKIGLYNNSVEKILISGLTDRHFEVRAYALIALRGFAEHVNDDIVKHIRLLARDRYFMVKYEALFTLGCTSNNIADLELLLSEVDAFDWKLRNSAIKGIISYLQRNSTAESIARVSEKLDSIPLTSNDHESLFRIKENYNKLLKMVEKS